MYFARPLNNNIKNIPGWWTNRKIVVFESDDWGSIRMPSRIVYKKLNEAGVDLNSGDSFRYNRYDSLATADDLECLYNILSSVKDSNGNHCVFTVVSVVANPDFKKIQASDFQEYHYEPFTETLKRYPACENSFKLWHEGMQQHLFVPQFHGREHLNVSAWLKALQTNHSHTRIAFNHGMWGFATSSEDNLSVPFQAAFDIEDISELFYQELVIKEGLQLFETLFGYSASYFVPPNGPFNSQLEKTAADYGVKFMSASKIQYEPQGKGRKKIKFHWMGQQNKYGQHYITRNCFFEPSQKGNDWKNMCLNDINIAFRWHKPAVISSHRVNYIGALDCSNRDNSLNQLKILLQTIVKKWPDVEFMTSDSLGKLIAKRNGC